MADFRNQIRQVNYAYGHKMNSDGDLSPNNNLGFGPWDSVDDAWAGLLATFGAETEAQNPDDEASGRNIIPIGIEVGVYTDSTKKTLQTYQLQGGWKRANLVEKAGGNIDVVKLEGNTLSITDKAVNIPAATNTTFGVVKAAVAYNSNVNATITFHGFSGVALKECYKVPTWVSSTKQVEALIPSATVNRPGLITETWFKRFYETYQKVQSGNDFDSSKTYAEGDIVKYDNALWEFNQAHTGAWDASHATKLEGLTNIVEEAKAAVDAKLLDFEKELYYVIHGIAYTG